MMRAILACVALALCGCAPTRVLVDGEYGTDKAAAASAILLWEHGPAYVGAGAVWDPAMYGHQPRGVVRIGADIPLR